MQQIKNNFRHVKDIEDQLWNIDADDLEDISSVNNLIDELEDVLLEIFLPERLLILCLSF